MGSTFIYTWVVNNARGSLLIAILLHAASNTAGSLVYLLVPQDMVLPAQVQALVPGWFTVIIFSLTALVLVLLTKGRLGYREADRVK